MLKPVIFPVFGGGGAGLPFEEFGQRGLVGEAEGFGDLLHGVLRIFEQPGDFPGECPADPAGNGLAGDVADDPVQVLRGDAKPGSIIIDRVLFVDMGVQ